MLDTSRPIAFIPTRDADRARPFFETTLGLHFLSDDGFALNFRTAGILLRVVRVGEFSPHIFTTFGWNVPDIDATVADLGSRGVQFLHIHGMDQSPTGIWTSPGGAKVAWFKDPDGNTLSVSSTNTATAI